MKDNVQKTFFAAIVLGHIDEVRGVLPGHPDAISWISPAGYPPLHMAILEHQPQIAVLLVEYGAGLEQKAHGETASTLAARKGMLEMLHDAAARVEQRGSDAVAACHAGLNQPVSVPRKPLSLKRRPLV